MGKYLAFLEGTYFIKTVRPFAKGRDVEIRKIPKLYFFDCGRAGFEAKLTPRETDARRLEKTARQIGLNS